MYLATYEPKRSVSNKRLAGSFFSLLLGIGMVYASIFYVPAFFDFKTILGFSNEDGKQPVIEISEDNKNPLAAYTEIFNIRRGYIRSGQALHVRYALSEGQQLTLSIHRCSAPVIVEIFTCMDSEGQEITISNNSRGSRDFVMRQDGFYYFDEKVTNADGAASNKPFAVEWSRRL